MTVHGEAGDVLVYVGQTWHMSGLNQTLNPRVALLGQFLPYYYAPMEAHAWTLAPRLISTFSPQLRALLGLTFRHPQRFGGCRRSLFEGAVFAKDTVQLVATGGWEHIGPASTRTESPANSANSRVWWAATLGGTLLIVACAQRHSSSRPQLNLGVVVKAATHALMPVSAGFVLGTMATLQRLWF